MIEQISKDKLEQLRNIPIQSLIAGKVKKNGNKISANCPFHNPYDLKEKSPSFFIYPDNGFHCFSCGVNGNGAISFVMSRDKINFKEAINVLDPKVNYEVTDQIYTPEDYLRSKGIDDIETQKKFGIKIISHEGHPAFQFNIPTGIEYRRFGVKPKYKHSFGATSCIFKTDDNNGDTCFITEGEIDAIVLNKFVGIPAWSASTGGGTKTVFEDNLVIFDSFKRIILLYDSDTEGRLDALNVSKILGLNKCYIVHCPAIDWSDFFILGYTKADFEKLLIEAKLATDNQSIIDNEINENETNEKKEKENWTKKIVNHANELGLKSFIDQYNRVIVSLPGSPVIAYSVDSIEFSNWIRGVTYKTFQVPIADITLKSVINTIKGSAFCENTIIKTHLRTAYEDNILYYNIGDGCNVVIIDKSGWNIQNFLQKTPPIYFHHTQLSTNQVFPLSGGNIHEVLKLINVIDTRSIAIYLTTLIVWLFPHIPRSQLVIVGPKGSAKSTTARITKMLEDPSTVPLLKEPKDLRDLAILTTHQSVLIFDNVSNISNEFSDFISMQITGGGYITRELYSNDSLTSFNCRPAIGITSINSVVNNPDLLSRSLLVKHAEIPVNKRRDEGEINDLFKQLSPSILGGMFSVASKVLQILPEIKLNNPPRMADAARIAAASWVAMGGSVSEYEHIMDQNEDAQNETVVENSIVAEAILELASGWSIDNFKIYTPTELFNELRKIINPEEPKFISGFPRSRNKLKSYITPLLGNLKSLGVEITDGRSGDSRWWKIQKLDNRKSDDTSSNENELNIFINRENDDGDDSDSSTFLKNIEKGKESIVNSNTKIIESVKESSQSTSEESMKQDMFNMWYKTHIPSMPTIPDLTSIYDTKEIKKYIENLSNWLGEFSGETRLSTEFKDAMALQKKLRQREKELSSN